jgi:hypothetical protein
MLANNILDEARARITWGDEPATVRDFLIASGMSTIDANATLRQLVHERNAEIRKIGITDVVIGSALRALAGVFFYFLFRPSHMPSVSYRAGKVYAVVILQALYGLWRLTNGIWRLACPKLEHGSIPTLQNKEQRK